MASVTSRSLLLLLVQCVAMATAQCNGGVIAASVLVPIVILLFLFLGLLFFLYRTNRLSLSPQKKQDPVELEEVHAHDGENGRESRTALSPQKKHDPVELEEVHAHDGEKGHVNHGLTPENDVEAGIDGHTSIEKNGSVPKKLDEVDAGLVRCDSVTLTGRETRGLGFSLMGGKGGQIVVESVNTSGPAAETDRIHKGDIVKSLKIYFDDMNLEDALTFLSYAGKYRVTVDLLKKPREHGIDINEITPDIRPLSDDEKSQVRLNDSDKFPSISHGIGESDDAGQVNVAIPDADIVSESPLKTESRVIGVDIPDISLPGNEDVSICVDSPVKTETYQLPLKDAINDPDLTVVSDLNDSVNDSAYHTPNDVSLCTDAMSPSINETQSSFDLTQSDGDGRKLSFDASMEFDLMLAKTNSTSDDNSLIRPSKIDKEIESISTGDDDMNLHKDIPHGELSVNVDGEDPTKGISFEQSKVEAPNGNLSLNYDTDSKIFNDIDVDTHQLANSSFSACIDEVKNNLIDSDIVENGITTTPEKGFVNISDVSPDDTVNITGNIDQITGNPSDIIDEGNKSDDFVHMPQIGEPTFGKISLSTDSNIEKEKPIPKQRYTLNIEDNLDLDIDKGKYSLDIDDNLPKLGANTGTFSDDHGQDNQHSKYGINIPNMQHDSGISVAPVLIFDDPPPLPSNPPPMDEQSFDSGAVDLQPFSFVGGKTKPTPSTSSDEELDDKHTINIQTDMNLPQFDSLEKDIEPSYAQRDIDWDTSLVQVDREIHQKEDKDDLIDELSKVMADDLNGTKDNLDLTVTHQTLAQDDDITQTTIDRNVDIDLKGIDKSDSSDDSSQNEEDPKSFYLDDWAPVVSLDDKNNTLTMDSENDLSGPKLYMNDISVLVDEPQNKEDYVQVHSDNVHVFDRNDEPDYQQIQMDDTEQSDDHDYESLLSPENTPIVDIDMTANTADTSIWSNDTSFVSSYDVLSDDDKGDNEVQDFGDPKVSIITENYSGDDREYVYPNVEDEKMSNAQEISVDSNKILANEFDAEMPRAISVGEHICDALEGDVPINSVRVCDSEVVCDAHEYPDMYHDASENNNIEYRSTSDDYHVCDAHENKVDKDSRNVIQMTDNLIDTVPVWNTNDVKSRSTSSSPASQRSSSDELSNDKPVHKIHSEFSQARENLSRLSNSSLSST